MVALIYDVMVAAFKVEILLENVYDSTTFGLCIFRGVVTLKV